MEPNILRTLSYGMYAIGVKGDNGPSACIVNTVMQVTNTAPLMITLSMSRDNYSCECIKKNKLFTVAVLSEDTSGAVVGALVSMAILLTLLVMEYAAIRRRMSRGY